MGGRDEEMREDPADGLGSGGQLTRRKISFLHHQTKPLFLFFFSWTTTTKWIDPPHRTTSTDGLAIVVVVELTHLSHLAHGWPARQRFILQLLWCTAERSRSGARAEQERCSLNLAELIRVMICSIQKGGMDDDDNDDDHLPADLCAGAGCALIRFESLRPSVHYYY